MCARYVIWLSKILWKLFQPTPRGWRENKWWRIILLRPYPFFEYEMLRWIVNEISSLHLVEFTMSLLMDNDTKYFIPFSNRIDVFKFFSSSLFLLCWGFKLINRIRMLPRVKQVKKCVCNNDVEGEMKMLNYFHFECVHFSFRDVRTLKLSEEILKWKWIWKLKNVFLC